MLTKDFVLLLVLAGGLVCERTPGQTVSNGEQVMPYAASLNVNTTYAAASVTLTGNVATLSVATGSFGGRAFLLTLCQGAGGPYTTPATWTNVTGATTIASSGCTRFHLVWDDPAATWVSTLQGQAPAAVNTASSPLAISGNNLSLPVATASANGYLASSDWSTFNSKQAAFGSQTANTVYAAPNAAAGTPGFRAIIPADIPTLNQSTTGQAGSVASIAGLVSAGTGISLSGAGTSASPYVVSGSSTSNPLNSSGLGYMVSDGHLSAGGLSVSGSTTLPAANRVYVTQFVLTSPMTFGHVTGDVSTGVSGATFNVGIYSASGAKLVDSGALSAATSTSYPTASFTETVLPPGVYYYAFATNNGGVYFATLPGFGSGTVANTVAIHGGYSANALASGSLPATLGTITSSAVTPLFVVFEY